MAQNSSNLNRQEDQAMGKESKSERKVTGE